MNSTLLIKNCKLILNNKIVIRNILINKGKISKITSKKIYAENSVDAKRNYVIPGVIDPHVHFREPGLTHKEDFFTGSYAAAVGGITTVLDMPNTIPQTTTIDILNKKRKLAKKSIVNYGFHFGGDFKAKNTAGNKLFMNQSTGKMLVEDKEKINNFFKNSKILLVHAENEKVEEAVTLAKKFKTKLYLCHLSLKSEIDFLKKNKTKNIFCEVTPHHLFLSDLDFKRKHGFAKMYPSLKSKKDQAALWNAVKNGLIDTIGTDHAPHTISEKNSRDSPAGVPGCETALPIMLDSANKKKISLTKVVRLMSTNPAKIFNIKNKGKIAKGYDADLVIIDINLKKKVQNKKLFTKCKWSPFNGRILKGWPVVTIVNGNIVFNKGKILTKKEGKEVEFF